MNKIIRKLKKYPIKEVFFFNISIQKAEVWHFKLTLKSSSRFFFFLWQLHDGPADWVFKMLDKESFPLVCSKKSLERRRHNSDFGISANCQIPQRIERLSCIFLFSRMVPACTLSSPVFRRSSGYRHRLILIYKLGVQTSVTMLFLKCETFE